MKLYNGIDLSKDNFTSLINLVNSFNETNFSPVDLTYSDVVQEKINIFRVTIKPIKSPALYNSKLVRYSKVDINKVLSSEPILFNAFYAVLVSDIVPMINSMFNINLTVGDYINHAITPYDPLNPFQTRTVKIDIIPSSLIYYGTFSFDLLNVANIGNNVINSTAHRYYYVFIKNTPITGYKNSVLKVNEDGTIDVEFNLGSNIISATTFIPDNVLMNSNNTFILLGTFNIVYTSNGVSYSNTYSTLFLNSKGLITDALVARLFNPNKGINYIKGKYDNYFYVIDPTIGVPVGTFIPPTQSSVFRYLSTGVLDNTFNNTIKPNLGYQPTIVKIADDNKIYVVANMSLALQQNSSYINRLNIDGSIDTTFKTVVIDSGRVLDLLPLLNDGLIVTISPYNLLTNTGGTLDNRLPGITINNVPLNNINKQGSYNNTVKILEDGTLDKSFNSQLNFINTSALYDTSVATDMVDNIISNINAQVPSTYRYNVINYSSNKKITVFNNRVNPITGYSSQIPVTFDKYGNIELLTGNEYLEQYVSYTTTENFSVNQLLNTIKQSDDKIIGYGVIKTLVNNVGVDNGYGNYYSALFRYNSNGGVDKVLLRLEDYSFGISGFISDVFLIE